MNRCKSHEQFEHQNVANTSENERFELQNVAVSSSKMLQIARETDRTGDPKNNPKAGKNIIPTTIRSQVYCNTMQYVSVCFGGRDAKLHHHYVPFLWPPHHVQEYVPFSYWSQSITLSTLQAFDSILYVRFSASDIHQIENQCLWGVHKISFRCHRKDQVHSTPPSRRNGWPFQEL